MDNLLEIILNKYPLLDTIIVGVLSTTGFFSFLATITPNGSSKKIVLGILKVINFLGCNFGKAKNRD
jgi:hypothetical protein